jgi:hypothetical protein
MSMEVLTVERSVPMKTNRSANLLRNAILCLALILLVNLMTIPLLVKGIAHAYGDPLDPKKLDIRPIPAPLPPLPLANNEPPITATPAPPLAAGQLPKAMPVPTPPTQVALPDSALAQNSLSGAAVRPSIPVVASRSAIANSVMFILLLFLIGWRRASSFRSMHQECAS